MSERLKPNFTPVPNVILEKLMRGLNEGELKVMMAICRFTYGWRKQSDQISLSQLSEITGMDRSNVARARKRLGNLVTVIPGNATTASTYQLNIDIADSDLTALGSDSSAPSDPSAASVNGSDPSATFHRKPKKEDKTGAFAPFRLSSSAVGTGPKKKKNATYPAQLEAFERFYSAYPRHIAKAEALKAWAKLAPSPELVTEIMAGVQQYADSVKDGNPKFTKHPGSWLNARRWEDEPVNISPANGNGSAPAFRRLPDGFLELTANKVRISEREFERRWGTIQPEGGPDDGSKTTA